MSNPAHLYTLHFSLHTQHYSTSSNLPVSISRCSKNIVILPTWAHVKTCTFSKNNETINQFWLIANWEPKQQSFRSTRCDEVACTWIFSWLRSPVRRRSKSVHSMTSPCSGSMAAVSTFCCEVRKQCRQKPPKLTKFYRLVQNPISSW